MYRRRWCPEDQNHRDGYGYSTTLVEGVESVEIPARQGSATVFNPRGYHCVAPSKPGCNRVNLSFFGGNR
ncbi:hypothetical protein [Corynebacterium cystitidis]|uniref:hypothetical protein n=1 Tax=Corynebacterium cystitidis TaxID=35757 RepID=UPI00211E9F38|nr:hypothetical protein [Corynebacterium cystitidis]